MDFCKKENSMKNISINENEFLIPFNGKYYVVNSFTKNLFEALSYTNNIEDLSQILNLSTRNIKNFFNKLDKLLLDAPYYERNLFLDEPIKLQWKITPECNLKCKHCYLGDLSIKKMPDKDLIAIAEKIGSSKVMEVTITGGEALTVACLPEMLERILTKDIKVHIFTNGILLESFLDKIPNYKYKNSLSFEVSVDGSKNDHDRIRGKGTYDKTMKGIMKAIELGYEVTTNTVLSRLNQNSVPDLFLFLKALGLKNIQISNLIDTGRADASMKLSQQEHEEFLKKMKHIIANSGGSEKLLYASQANSIIYSSNGNQDIVLGKEKWHCGAGIGRATIDYKGNIYCCPFWQKSCLGNILKDTLNHIWKSRNKYLFLKELATLNSNTRVCIVAQDRVCNE